MEIENLIDELEDMMEAAWGLPMSGGRVVMNSNEIKRVLDDIRSKLPKELVQAKKIVEDRAKIIESAKNEAETMLKVSEEKIKIMISKEEIVKSAQNFANNLLSEAKTKAKEIKDSSAEYADEIMKQLDETITANLTEIRKTRQMLRSPEFKEENQ